MSGWVVERRRQARLPNVVEARKPRRVSARSGMQYSHDEYGLREKTCPEGAADERVVRMCSGRGERRRNAERESPGDEPGGGLPEGNTLKGKNPMSVSSMKQGCRERRG
jgi:hypothetical protein